MRRCGHSDVTVISVCYKSNDVIGAMISTVPLEIPIIIVDNGGGIDIDVSFADRRVEVIKLPENRGFGQGCNSGAEHAKTRWLLFLNPDAKLEAFAVDNLLEAAEKYPGASAFNPRMAGSDGSAYFKRRSYLLPRGEYMKRGWPQDDCRVPVLSGAAIFVSKVNFEKAGRFDPNIFLYHEDDDLSLRLRRLGPLMYIRKALVVHAGGRSSGRSTGIAYMKAYHMAQSRIYAGRKYGRPWPRLSVCFEAFMLWLSPQTWFSKRRRAKGSGFLAGIAKSFSRQ